MHPFFIDGHGFTIEGEDKDHPGFTRIQYNPPPYGHTYHLSIPTVLLQSLGDKFRNQGDEAIPAVDGGTKNLWDHLLS